MSSKRFPGFISIRNYAKIRTFDSQPMNKDQNSLVAIYCKKKNIDYIKNTIV